MTGRWTTGRYVRTLLGIALFFLDAAILFLSVYGAYKNKVAYEPNWQVVTLQLALLAAAWALVHKESLIDVLEVLPVVGRVGRMLRKPPT